MCHVSLQGFAIAEINATSRKLHIQRSLRFFKITQDFSQILAKTHHVTAWWRAMWHHRDAHSAEAPFDSRASSTSTAKSSRLPTNITAKNRAEQLRATAVSNSCSFSQKSTETPQITLRIFKKVTKKKKQNCEILYRLIYIYIILYSVLHWYWHTW